MYQVRSNKNEKLMFNMSSVKGLLEKIPTISKL